MAFVAPFLSGALGSLSMAAVVVGAVGHIVSSQAQARQQAKMYEQNAELAKKEAAREAERQKRRYAELAESKQSGYAASGIALDSGSVLGTLASIDAEGEVAAQNARNSGRLQAADFENRISNTLKSAGYGALNSISTLSGRMGSILGDAR